MKRSILISTILTLIAFTNPFNSAAQNPFWEQIKKQPATLGIDQGSKKATLKNLNVTILHSSQTLASLKLNTDQNFDYTPDELLNKRDRDKFYHFGDLNLSIRNTNQNTWTKFSSATVRKPIIPINSSNTEIIAAADITSTLGDIPLQVKRFWENKNGDLILRFEIKNPTNNTYEIGALGIPMIFNNNMDWKNLDTAHMDNVFFDPYIGKDAGFLQVNRLHGKGPSLLVLPYQNAGFEAYNPINSDPTPRSITFEGFHEWMIHSKAYVENEWKGIDQWNQPTSTILKPNDSKSFAIRLVLAPSIKQIEEELIRQKRPVAIGAPGYLLPLNNKAKLFLNSAQNVKDITSYPEDFLEIDREVKKTQNNWLTYNVTGKKWGKARIEITYDDGSLQTIHYKIIKPEKEVVNDLGNFLTTTQWYENSTDLFGRSPSVITYDYETKEHVTQEQRAWYAGLSDEAGAASWLAAMMKQLLQPDQQEVNKLKRFANETMYGRIQIKEGDKKYGVVKSLFYYEPDSMPKGTYSDKINFKTWSAWPKKEADNIGRSYNYPHVAAAHWVLFKLSKNYQNLVTEEAPSTYLDRAYNTAIAMIEKAPYYSQFGQMEGSIFLFILEDLEREGMTKEAEHLKAVMQKRALHWASLNYPFGSEMPWDSTGQEEVYLWSKYFGYDDKADVTLNAILAYMPTIPHWGYNGSARRYWDFVYGGKLSRIERQLHHYGSALNSIPVLHDYRDNPSDFYLLRVGHAGAMGALANVTEDGFGPAAFHSYPSTLANDGISGDYGSGFYGYAVNSGTYIINHPEFHWLAFSGNLTKKGKNVSVDITSAAQNRVFLAEENLWLTTDAGEIKRIEYNTKTKNVILTFNPSVNNNQINSILLNINKESGYKISGIKTDKNGTYQIPTKTTSVTLTKN